MKILAEANISKEGTHFSIDKTFFKVIDNEEKAYWLGQMYSDGFTIDGKKSVQFGLSFSIVDELHLEKFRTALKSNHSFYYVNSHKTNYKEKEYIGKPQVKLVISSIDIFNDLVKLGCIPNKTFTIKYPDNNIIPIELQHHFIRGIFDGDGCLSFLKKINKYNRISILGTKDLLDGIAKFLDLKSNYAIRPNKNIYEFYISNKEGIYEFYNKIYKDATVFLDRKYEYFQAFLKDYLKGDN